MHVHPAHVVRLHRPLIRLYPPPLKCWFIHKYVWISFFFPTHTLSLSLIPSIFVFLLFINSFQACIYALKEFTYIQSVADAVWGCIWQDAVRHPRKNDKIDGDEREFFVEISMFIYFNWENVFCLDSNKI